jgi:hypothetical protein
MMILTGTIHKYFEVSITIYGIVVFGKYPIKNFYLSRKIVTIFTKHNRIYCKPEAL